MELPENRKKALIVALYLSKFDTVAYKNLGIGTQAQTHKYIGEILDVKPNALKNMRDDFDPWENNSRVGWYQRPLSPSRAKVKKDFDNLEENLFQRIIDDILFGGEDLKYNDIVSLIKSYEDEKFNKENINNFVLYEGLAKEVTFLQKERNQEIIKLVKKRDNYTCQACGFHYKNKIVEAHHLIPISSKSEEYLVTSDHLVILCPNCHALAHLLLGKNDKYQDKAMLIAEIKSILVNS